MLSQISIANQERREPSFRREGMIERKNDHIVIDDVKGMTKLAGIANAGEVTDVRPMPLQEIKQSRCRLIGESKHHLVPHVLLDRVAGNAPENGEAFTHRLIDRLQVAAFHVGKDSISSSGNMNEMPPDVAVSAQGEIDERVFRSRPSGERSESRAQVFRACNDAFRLLMTAVGLNRHLRTGCDALHTGIPVLANAGPKVY